MAVESDAERRWREFMERDSEEDLRLWNEAAIRDLAKTFPPNEFADWDPPTVCEPRPKSVGNARAIEDRAARPDEQAG